MKNRLVEVEGEDSMGGKYPVSVCIVCFNEERNIGACLGALTWADEIIVVDSFSTDRTVEIAGKFTGRVLLREWKGYLDQKNYAVGLAKNEWILLMDADEVLTEALAEEIKGEINGGGDCYGYYLRRRLYYLGKWLARGEWYPDYKLRLFRKSAAHIGGMEPHDSIHITEGEVKCLKGDMLHYSYDSIEDQMNTLNKYSSISARGLFKKGVRAPLCRMLLHPAWRFFQGFFLRKGFMDGIPGFVIAVTNSFYVFLKYAKLWELYLDSRRGPGRGAGES